MKGRGLASFAAGFGTGFLQTKEKERERKRQDEIDRQAAELREIQINQAKRQEEREIKVDKLNDEIAAIPSETYGTKRDMTGDDVRTMVGGSDDPNAENYVSEEATSHYLKNNTGAEQVKNNAAYYAQEGISKNFDGMKPVQEGEKVSLADPSSAKKREPWKIMEQAAQKRIASGIPEQMNLGYAAIAQATTMKSQAIRDGLMKVMQKPGDKVANLLEFASNWDNDDFPVTDLRVEKVDDNTTKVFGIVGGQEKMVRQYDMTKMPKGMTVEDAIFGELMVMSDPSKMFDYQKEQLTMRREDETRDLQLQKLKLDIDAGKITLESLPKETQLKLQALQANINQSNAATEKSKEETNNLKTNAGLTKLPASVQEAMWYQSATPEQKLVFDKLQDKTAKITADGTGGYMITQKDGNYRMDRAGNVKKVNMPVDSEGTDIPATWKQVGTSGGQPVYEDENGKRHIRPQTP